MNVTQTTHSAQAVNSVVTPRLAAAAKQFDSVLLGQWLKGAESSFASVPGGDEDTYSGGQQMQGFATQELATSLTAGGGIGIAKLVGNALVKASEREQAGAATTAASSTQAIAAYAAEARQ